MSLTVFSPRTDYLVRTHIFLPQHLTKDFLIILHSFFHPGVQAENPKLGHMLMVFQTLQYLYTYGSDTWNNKMLWKIFCCKSFYRNVSFISLYNVLYCHSCLVGRSVWEEMINACWCGLLAALSLLLDAR